MEFEVNWGDGTNDIIKVSYNDNYGDQEVTIRSNANNTNEERRKTLVFSTYNFPYKKVTLTVIQNPRTIETIEEI